MRNPDVSTDPLDRTRFPLAPWRLVELYPGTDLGATETLFTVGNGYLGMRGNPEEGRTSVINGSYINGFHETWQISHAEDAYGFARTGQTIVNVPDAKTLKLYVDDEPLLVEVADLEHYERSLDFRDGLLRRELVWRTPSGKRVAVNTTRMVSIPERHLAIMTMEITMLSGDASVVVSSQLLNRQDGVSEYQTKAAHNGDFDPRRAGGFDHRVLQSEGHWHSERRMILGYRCANSGMTLAVAADHEIQTDNPHEDLITTEPDFGRRVYRINARQGEPITITKTVAYHTSRGVPARELFDRCRRTLDRVRESGCEPLFAAQREWLATYWADADVVVPNQPAIQQAIRYCLFQLAQAAGRADGLGVAVKGVTGSGYEGHAFWDTEIYVIPFLAFTAPQLARNALRFRVSQLPAALTRAKELSQRGALYPWRTINGEEASAYYAAGTAQYHIDADIAFALMKYANVTGDLDFLYRDAAPVLVQTARLWADLGFWRTDGERSRFEIHGVTGPDEYTTVVNNNLFTNVMARANLAAAADVVRSMRADDPVAFQRLVTTIGLTEDEITEWQACAQGMYIPFDQTLGLNPQDDHFLGREMWDLDGTPDDRFPLLLNYHPLVIYRFQVLKQADVVLAQFLHGEQFTEDQKKANFEYYDRITTGDSSLSAVVQSIMAAEIGYPELAYQYFLAGLYVDLADLHHNTVDGVHIASCGGIWNSLVYGFGGMRDHGGRLSFDPRLPADWDGLSFKLRVRGQQLAVRLSTDAIEFHLIGTAALEFSVRGENHRLRPGDDLRVELAGQGPQRPTSEAAAPETLRRGDDTLIMAVVPDTTADLESEDEAAGLSD